MYPQICCPLSPAYAACAGCGGAATGVAAAEFVGLRKHVFPVHGLCVLCVGRLLLVLAPEFCSRSHELGLRRIEVTRFKASVFECVLYEEIVLG